MCFYDQMTPYGEWTVGRGMESPSPDANLLELVLTQENVDWAWAKVRSNKGKPGVDKVTVEDFPAVLATKWKDIRQLILTGNYTPSPVKRVEIPKDTGGKRPLGIPIVQDRLIQQAISQVLTPIFDPMFSNFSYGYRPGKSAKDAVLQAREFIRQGYKVVVDTDLSKFFDTVEHDVLMHRVSRKVKDKGLLRLLGKILRAGVSIKGRLQETVRGVPQGGPLSPLLANIMLDDFDKELERRGLRFVRYADDFCIFVKTMRSGQRVAASIKAFLKRKLKLTVNESKSKVRKANELEYLGFQFKGNDIRWSDKAYLEFRRRVKEYTGRSWGVSMSFRLKRLAQYLRGWMGYFGIAKYYTPIPLIDSWLRRRIRACFWKTWRRVRTRVRELLKLGVPLKVTLLTAVSRQGPWHLSRTKATQMGMHDKWLAEQGLISVKDLWTRIHYPATAR